MKRILIEGISILLCIGIGFSIVTLVNEKNSEEIQAQQELKLKLVEQSTTKAISLLEGDGNIIKSSQVEFPADDQKYAVIHNDERGFTKDLYYGDNNAILDVSIGQSKLSHIPGQGKPILIAGHNGTHFYLLPSFEVGDKVQIDTSYGNYVYEVYDSEIMLAEDFQVTTLDEDEEYLIMYTCYPFDVVHTPQRYFVYAKKIAGPVIEEDGTWKE